MDAKSPYLSPIVISFPSSLVRHSSPCLHVVRLLTGHYHLGPSLSLIGLVDFLAPCKARFYLEVTFLAIQAMGKPETEGIEFRIINVRDFGELLCFEICI